MAGLPAASAYRRSGLAESSLRPARGPGPLVRYAHTGRGPPQNAEHFRHPGTSNEPLPERPREVQAIAVMGPTGSGKSTFISKLAGSAVEIGHNLTSRTQDIVEVRCRIGDKYIMLVDTPGFNDTVRSDTEILGLLVDWMKDSYGERQLSGLIYLHDISGARMTGSILRYLQMFRKLCGDENLRNVILATTKWEITPQSDAILRERELCSDQGFWGLMINNGSKVRRFDDTEASARSLVQELLNTGSNGFTPKIQREVVEEGKSLWQTDAGAFIEEALARQARIHMEEMKSLVEEQERAFRKRMERRLSPPALTSALTQGTDDRDMQAELEKHCKSLEREIAAREEQRRILHLDELEIIKRKIKDLQKHLKRRELRNRRGFWYTHWKCLACGKKTGIQGTWVCPRCRTPHKNLL